MDKFCILHIDAVSVGMYCVRSIVFNIQNTCKYMLQRKKEQHKPTTDNGVIFFVKKPYKHITLLQRCSSVVAALLQHCLEVIR